MGKSRRSVGATTIGGGNETETVDFETRTRWESQIKDEVQNNLSENDIKNFVDSVIENGFEITNWIL